jgi:hypothetical protein
MFGGFEAHPEEDVDRSGGGRPGVQVVVADHDEEIDYVEVLHAFFAGVAGFDLV